MDESIFDFLSYVEETYAYGFDLGDFLDMIRPMSVDWTYYALELAVEDSLLTAAEIMDLIYYLEQDPTFLDPPDCRRVLEAAFIRKFDTEESLCNFFSSVYDAEERERSRVMYSQLFYDLILDRDF
jgi:hypothetical protein